MAKIPLKRQTSLTKHFPVKRTPSSEEEAKTTGRDNVVVISALSQQQKDAKLNLLNHNANRQTTAANGKNAVKSYAAAENTTDSSSKRQRTNSFSGTTGENVKVIAVAAKNNIGTERAASVSSDDNAKDQDNKESPSARKPISTAAKVKPVISFEEALSRGAGKSKPDITRKNSGGSGRQIMLIPVQPAPVQPNTTTTAKHARQQV